MLAASIVAACVGALLLAIAGRKRPNKQAGV